MKRLVVAGIASLVLGSAASAQIRQLDAHEHGVGQLDIAVEDRTIVMELRAPGADILGFEHAAESDEDKQALERALAMLDKPMELFVPPSAAGCSVSEAAAELLLEGGDHDDHHDSAENVEHDDHDEQSEADHDEDAEHDEHGEHEASAGHSELHASYTLTCTDPSALTDLDMAYFEAFPNAERLIIQLISAQGAQVLEATRDAPSLDLGKL